MEVITKENVKWADFNTFSYFPRIKQNDKRKVHIHKKTVPKLLDIVSCFVAKQYNFNELNSIINGLSFEKQIGNFIYSLANSKSHLSVIFNEYLMKYNFSMDFGNIHKIWLLNRVNFESFHDGVNYCKTNSVINLIQCGNVLLSVVVNNRGGDFENVMDNEFFQKFQICIEVEKCRIIKYICTCNRGRKNICSHIIATIFDRTFSPDKLEIIPPETNEVEFFVKVTGIELDRIVCRHLNWSRNIKSNLIKLNITSCKEDSLKFNNELLNSSTDKTISETMVYFEKIMENVLEFIEESNGPRNLMRKLCDIRATIYNLPIMEEYLYNFFKLKKIDHFPFYLRHIQHTFEMLKELSYTNDGCGFYGSIYFLTRIFYASHFPEILFIYLQQYNLKYKKVFIPDALLNEPTFEDLVHEGKDIEDIVRSNVIGFMILECVRIIRRFSFNKNISNNDLEAIKDILLKLGIKFETFLNRKTMPFLNDDVDLTILFNPISRLLFSTVNDINTLLNEKKMNAKDVSNNEVAKNYNFTYGIKQIVNMSEDPFISHYYYNKYLDEFPVNIKSFNSEINTHIKVYEAYDRPLLEEFNSIKYLKIRQGQNFTTIKKFIDHYTNLEKIMKLYITFDNDTSKLSHLPHKFMMKTYDQFYECISIVYNMAYNDLNRMIFNCNAVEVCELLFTVMAVPRIFLYDYIQEIHLWSFQSKFLEIFKILINTKNKKKDTIKYFAGKIDSIKEIFNLRELNEPGRLINCYFFGMVSKICSDNVNDCTKFPKYFKNHVKNVYKEIMFRYLDYSPNISTKSFFNYLQIFYEDKAKFVGENINSNRGCCSYLHEIMDKILLSKYGNLYSSGKANCYTLNEKLCNHSISHKNEVAPNIFLFYITKIIRVLCMNKFEGIVEWKLMEYEIDIKEVNRKSSNIYYVSLLLATYGSCINQRNRFLSEDDNLMMTIKIFSPRKFLHYLPIQLLETVDTSYCFSINVVFDLALKGLKSKYSDIRNRGLVILLDLLKEVYNIDLKRVGYFFYILEKKLNNIKALNVARKNVMIAFERLCRRYTTTEYYKDNIKYYIKNISGRNDDWRSDIISLLLKANNNVMHTYIYRFLNITNIDYELHYEDTFIIIKELYKIKNEIEFSMNKKIFTCIKFEDGLTLFYRNIRNNIASYDDWWHYERLEREIEKTTYVTYLF
uniref:SWIM-type domain-containing protein n=1 Tax=Strongyloides venezuelensis TaxID=75913 RepID=A0A0K0F2S0_STRVS